MSYLHINSDRMRVSLFLSKGILDFTDLLVPRFMLSTDIVKVTSKQMLDRKGYFMYNRSQVTMSV